MEDIHDNTAQNEQMLRIAMMLKIMSIARKSLQMALHHENVALKNDRIQKK